MLCWFFECFSRGDCGKPQNVELDTFQINLDNFQTKLDSFHIKAVTLPSYPRLLKLKQTPPNRNEMSLLYIKFESLRKGPSRSFGGQPLTDSDQCPWVARISTNDSLCSGSLISPRHILTAAHCVHNYNETERQEHCQKHGDKGSEYPLRNETEFTVYVGNKCIHPIGCQKPHYVERVISHLVSRCMHSSDIAILELDDDVPVHEATPICLPTENLKIAEQLGLAGAGYNPTLRNSGILRVVKLFYVGGENDEGFVVGKNSSACPGDSGGPLFQKGEDDRLTAVGVTKSIPARSTEEDPCENEDLSQGEWTNFFTDVRRYIGWICRNTGVCYMVKKWNGLS